MRRGLTCFACARRAPYGPSLVLTLVTLLLSSSALAQGLNPNQAMGVGPNEVPLGVPDLTDDPAPAPALELPPFPQIPDRAGAPMPLEARLRVTRFDIVGSTVFEPAELDAAVREFTAREIDSDELLAARDAVTKLYIDHGYLTSGAVIPDQKPEDGVIRIEIVEGELAEVVLEGNRRFRDHYFRTRLMAAGKTPLRMDRLEESIRLLQADPRIERVAAELQPGDQLGQSRLVVRVTEARMIDGSVAALNDRSPAVGSMGGRLDTTVANLAGFDDELVFWGQFTKGLVDIYASYDIAVTRWDTRLQFAYRYTDSEIVEAPFDTLDIDANVQTVTAALHQPLHRSDRTEIWASVIFDYRKSRASILDMPFCFEISSQPCSETKLSIVRLASEWTRRTRRNVWAARGQLSLGFDGLGSTITNGTDPDSKYVSFLLQTQWVHLLPEKLLSTQLVTRIDGQFSNDALLAIEQFGIGGVRSVRGYRQNQLIGDNGAFGSFEARIPVWRDSFKRTRLAIIPFVDIGHVWNQRPEPAGRINTLSSAGIGGRLTPVPWFSAELFYGYQIKDIPNPKDSLQDHGVNLRISLQLP